MMTIFCSREEKKRLIRVLAGSEVDCILSECPSLEIECEDCIENNINWVVEP